MTDKQRENVREANREYWAEMNRIADMIRSGIKVEGP